MPDEPQPGQGAPMWPTDDEDRGSAEASTPKPSEKKPAESAKAPDQPKPAAPSEPLWPTDEAEDPDEAPAQPVAEQPPAEPADTAENKPADSPEPSRKKPAESEDAGQRPVERAPEPPQEPAENKPAESEDTVRVAAEDVSGRPPEPERKKPAESVAPGRDADDEADDAAEPEPETEPADAGDEPVTTTEKKPAESEGAGQQGERNKPAGFGEDEREAAQQVEEPRRNKPAESEVAGQRGWDPERTVPAGGEPEQKGQATADLRIPEVQRDLRDREDEQDRQGPAKSQDWRDQEGRPDQQVRRDEEAQRDEQRQLAEQERAEQDRARQERAERELLAEQARRDEQVRRDEEARRDEQARRDEVARRGEDERVGGGGEDEGDDGDDGEATQAVAVGGPEAESEPEAEPDSESTQRVASTGEQPALTRRYVEDTQVIDLRTIQPPRRPGPPPPSSPLQRPQQQRPQGPQGPQRQGPPRPSGPPPGRVIPPVGPPRARPMRIDPRAPEPESAAERTEMFHLEPPPRREQLQRREPEPLPAHREMLQRKAAEPEEYDDLYDRLYDEDDQDDDGGDKPPRRRRKGLLITLLSLVVVLAVAAGVVFFVPGVANKLGLKGANDVAIAPPPTPVAFSPELKGPDPQAPNPTQSGVAQAIEGPASAGTLGTLTGTVVDPADGTVLWDRNSDTGLTPASTGKLLTSAAALLSLDHTTQFVTRVVQGDQPGTVVLVGGGDLTLNSLPPGEDSVYPGSAHVADLIAQVKKATGGKVSKVLIDTHRYAGPLLAPGWDAKDVAAGYETPMEPVMMDGGRADPTEPEKSTRSSRPARAVASKIADAFGATVPEDATATAKSNAPVLGEVRSAPLVELIDNLLQISDNMLAEGVLREVAKQNDEEVSYAGGVRAVKKVLQDNGFDVSGYQMVDGSGLSTQDKATAKLLAAVLAVAAGPDGKDPRTAKLRPLLGGLPVAGGSGTLNPRFHDDKSKEGKGWVRAKTGTLTGVNTLAGVVLDKDGRVLVFALMSNNGDGLQAPPALDAVAARLRECGCG